MKTLEQYLSDNGDIGLAGVIEVQVSDDVARERVLGRARGADDAREVFERRLHIYVEPLEAIQAFYRNKNLLHVIDGERSIDNVVHEMETCITSKI